MELMKRTFRRGGIRRTYLVAAVKAQVSWADAEQDIRDYLTAKNCTAQWINTEVARAKPLLEPWLQ
jgi:hypothetical protein